MTYPELNNETANQLFGTFVTPKAPVREKKCYKCKVVKPFKAFGKHGKAKDGLQSWCTECKRAYARDMARKRNKKPKFKDVRAFSEIDGTFVELKFSQRVVQDTLLLLINIPKSKQ